MRYLQLMLPGGQSEDDRVGIIPVNIINEIPNECTSCLKQLTGHHPTRVIEISVIDKHSRDVHPEGIAARVGSNTSQGDLVVAVSRDGDGIDRPAVALSGWGVGGIANTPINEDERTAGRLRSIRPELERIGLGAALCLDNRAHRRECRAQSWRRCVETHIVHIEQALSPRIIHTEGQAAHT